MFFERVVQAGRHTEWRRRERWRRERRERRWVRRGGDTRGGREDVFVQSVDHKQDR